MCRANELDSKKYERGYPRPSRSLRRCRASPMTEDGLRRAPTGWAVEQLLDFMDLESMEAERASIMGARGKARPFMGFNNNKNNTLTSTR